MADPSPSRPTLVGVADRAGVSVSTASRVLAQRGDFSPRTRHAVFAAAAELGYDRSSSRRTRPAADTRVIELVIGGLAGSWAGRAVGGAHERAFELGYDLVLMKERESPGDDWASRVLTRRSSGVITALLTPTTTQVEALRRSGTPIVLLDPRGETDAAIPTVTATNRQGGFDAGQHLVDAGYTRFAICVSALRYRFGRARAEGCRAAIELAHPGADIVTVEAEWDGRVPRATIDRLVASAGEGRLGVFALNDGMAHGLCVGLLNAGLRIPEDVGVVGFDDDRRGRPVPLTTVRQPVQEMAARAVDWIDGLRSGQPPTDRLIELPTELIVRASTAGH